MNEKNAVKPCVVGVDFGSLSARALIVEAATGRELASAVMEYPHGVMSEALPDGTPLKPDWALEHPADYLECLRTVIPEAIRRAGVPASDVVGLGIDVTACTVLPVDADNEPLCFKPEYAGVPHAWMMLWKHHAAQEFANRMTRVADGRSERFLERYGGKVSSEWLFPRLWQVLEEAPEIYAAADRFIDAADWLVQKLTGSDVRAAGIAGYKYFWNKAEGYPSEDYFAALDKRLRHVVRDKLRGEVRPIGSRGGRLTAAGAAMTGLLPGTAVAVGNIDAHVSMPSIGRVEAGDYLMIIGTSSCHMFVDREERAIPGICGRVEDGIIPGLFGYEAGQSCVGDSFAWFVERCCPASARAAAEAAGVGLHEWLTERAARLRPGQSGLLALDWWNGNRSVLVDADLTGLILGLNLSTQPEEIYRALIESTAYGARTIVDNFERHGAKVRRMFACGGIAKKNPFLMQVYADVLNREIRVVSSNQSGALGAAVFGSVAAELYPTVADAAAAMGGVDARVYAPIPENAAVYDALYREYVRLHDLFGRGGCDAMKRLKQIRDRQA